ncbi:hypothetical protein [Methanosarcina sp.]
MQLEQSGMTLFRKINRKAFQGFGKGGKVLCMPEADAGDDVDKN